MTRPRRFDLIAFDWDGTLFDSTALIARCIQAACADLGVPVPSDAGAATSSAWAWAMRCSTPRRACRPSATASSAERYRHHYFARQHELVLFDGTLEMLQALKARNHLLGVATGKSRRGLDEALGSVELQGLFDATRTADETACKPDPLMLLELMAEFGVEPAAHPDDRRHHPRPAARRQRRHGARRR